MVDKELFDEFRKALDGNLELMGRSFDDLMRQCEGMPQREMRAFLARSYMQIVSQHGIYASVSAMEFYELSRMLAELSTAYEASVFLPQNERLLQYDANTILSVQQEVDMLLTKLLQTATERVMEYADETLLENAKADPARPKWALVPHVGACGWCQFIASQGFVYSTEGKVARHSSCKCATVVDFDAKNPSLDGYDPEALREKYKEARKEAEKGAWEEWSALPKSEREKYGGKRRGAYDHFLRNRIVAHM